MSAKKPLPKSTFTTEWSGAPLLLYVKPLIGSGTFTLSNGTTLDSTSLHRISNLGAEGAYLAQSALTAVTTFMSDLCENARKSLASTQKPYDKDAYIAYTVWKMYRSFAMDYFASVKALAKFEDIDMAEYGLNFDTNIFGRFYAYEYVIRAYSSYNSGPITYEDALDNGIPAILYTKDAASEKDVSQFVTFIGEVIKKAQVVVKSTTRIRTAFLTHLRTLMDYSPGIIKTENAFIAAAIGENVRAYEVLVEVSKQPPKASKQQENAAVIDLDPPPQPSVTLPPPPKPQPTRPLTSGEKKEALPPPSEIPHQPKADEGKGVPQERELRRISEEEAYEMASVFAYMTGPIIRGAHSKVEQYVMESATDAKPTIADLTDALFLLPEIVNTEVATYRWIAVRLLQAIATFLQSADNIGTKVDIMSKMLQTEADEIVGILTQNELVANVTYYNKTTTNIPSADVFPAKSDCTLALYRYGTRTKAKQSGYIPAEVRQPPPSSVARPVSTAKPVLTSKKTGLKFVSIAWPNETKADKYPLLFANNTGKLLCHFNAVLQVMIHTPQLFDAFASLWKYVKDDDIPVVKAAGLHTAPQYLAELAETIANDEKHMRGTLVDMYVCYRALAMAQRDEGTRHDMLNYPQDAQETAACIIDSVRQTKARPLVEHLIESRIVETVTCDTCKDTDSRTVTTDAIMIDMRNLTKNGTPVVDMLATSPDVVTLDLDDVLFQNKTSRRTQPSHIGSGTTSCKGLTVTQTDVYTYGAPVMIFRLIRDVPTRMPKTGEKFPPRKYLGISVTISDPDNVQLGEYTYRLTGTVEYYPQDMHYKARVRSDDKWFLLNDQNKPVEITENESYGVHTVLMIFERNK